MALVGCGSTPDPVIVYETNEIVHPSMPSPPPNPGVRILVLTTETIEDKQAYIGFTYNEWLKFAEWMHAYKTYNKDLRHVIELYKGQDQSLQEEEVKESD
ncbi:Rz-like spanin [Vibrio phage D480]